MAPQGLPPRVAAARALAEATGFAHSCSDATGRILQLLAASRPGGRLLEIGTGAGVGAAWLEAGMSPAAHLWTVEIDGERARAARDLFRGAPNVHVLHAHWRASLAHAPFDLVFADGGKAKERDPEAILRALVPGGIALIDDLTPPQFWPQEWRGREDPVRRWWLSGNPWLLAAEILESPERALIVAVRRGD